MRTNIEAARLARIRDQIERERSVARPIVAALRSTIHERWDSEVPAHWRTAGFVEELTLAAHDLLKQYPPTAQALAQYAVVVATSIPEELYPAPILIVRTAEAWKELASTHRYMSQHDAALRALDAADRCLDGVASVGYQRAVLRFARAVAYSEMNRLDEARVLAEESIKVFVEFVEPNRAAHGMLLVGLVEQRAGRPKEARRWFQLATEQFSRTSDLSGLASAFHNLGCAQAELGDTSDAVSSLHDALAIFLDLELTGETARTRCVLASILIRTGGLDRAHDLLSAARQTFAELGMVEEVGLAGLSLTDVLLAQGRTQEAQALVSDVVAEFRAANLNERALVALSYLQEMLPGPRGRDAVRHVRRFIEELNQTPLQLFAALPE